METFSLEKTVHHSRWSWSPDSKYIASGGYAHTNIWDASVAGGVLRTYQGDSSWIHAVAWSPDGKYIASGGDNKTVHIWDANTAVEPLYVYTGYTDPVYAVVWSPDSKRIASAGSSGEGRVWQAV